MNTISKVSAPLSAIDPDHPEFHPAYLRALDDPKRSDVDSLPCPNGCFGDPDPLHPCAYCEGFEEVVLCIGCHEPMSARHLAICARCRCDDDVTDEDSIMVLDAIADFDRYPSLDDAIDSGVFHLSPEDDAFTEVFDY